VIRLSRRHALATALLLALAALPVWLRQVAGATSDPCADPSAIWRLPAYGMQYRWIDNRQTNGEFFPLALGGDVALLGPDVDFHHFFVLRSDDPFEFYGDPESRVVSRPLPTDRTSLKLVAAGSDVLPVHRRYDDSLGITRFSQFFLVQGMRPISHPMPGGLEAAWDQLVHGVQPVAMFVIQAYTENATLPEVEAKAEGWLAQVWSDYREACQP
jgi:hypothetical protein